MITDPEEIAIIRKARQKNVADPNRSREHFHRIFEDFFGRTDLTQQTVLDLGPGHWDFGELSRARGAPRIVGIDRDPAVLELGRHKGFVALEGDLRRPWEIEGLAPVDGLFCKFSINAFWHAGDDALAERMTNTYLGLLKPDGWGWIAPWNGVPKGLAVADEDLKRMVERQRTWFAQAGFQMRMLSEDETRYYGVHGEVYNSPLFLRF